MFSNSQIPDFHLKSGKQTQKLNNICDIERAVQNGMISPHYLVKNATDRLEAYVDLYLRRRYRRKPLCRILYDTLIGYEIPAYTKVINRRINISYCHTYTGLEVDLVIGDASVAIEIKSSEEVMNRHKTGLNAFKEEYPDCRAILVSLDPITRPSSGMELIYVNDFLKMLWNGEIF